MGSTRRQRKRSRHTCAYGRCSSCRRLEISSIFRNARGRKIYGRGSVDNKGPAVACLYGMKAVMDAGLPMSNHVRIIAGTDEETFARGIHYYLERENAPAYGFSPDAEFPIIYAEKGIIRFGYRLPLALPDKNILSIHAGTRLNVVPSLRKSRLPA